MTILFEKNTVYGPQIINAGEIVRVEQGAVINGGSLGTAPGMYGALYFDYLEGSVSTIVNFGKILSAKTAIESGHNNKLIIENRGTIQSASETDPVIDAGQADIRNYGTIDGNIVTGNANDTIYNSGNIYGSIQLFGGNDKYTNTGSSGQSVYDAPGSDEYRLGTGRDIYSSFFGVWRTMSDGTDIVDAGGGYDVYRASSVTFAPSTDVQTNYALRINLSTTDLTISDGSGTRTFRANTATDANNVGIEKVYGFEEVFGTSNSDYIFGGAASEVLSGGLNGTDLIWGGGGDDTITGHRGTTTMRGGAGADKMVGGFGIDRFLFSSVTESAVTRPDQIIGFDVVKDFINLISIDANIATTSNEAFTWLGISSTSKFTGRAGELQALNSSRGGGYDLVGDVNGDYRADFLIWVDTLTLTSSDIGL